MIKSKPVEELTIEDLKENSIWEWAIETEENEEHDETWVSPAETEDFTEELNGSIVLGEAMMNEKTFPVLCSLDVQDDDVLISSIILYYQEQDAYHAIEDRVKEINFPLTINIDLMINGEMHFLKFNATKVDIYKNNLKTSLV